MDVLDFPIDRTGRLSPGHGPTAGSCRHDRLEIGGLVAETCQATGTMTWTDRSGPLDPAEAVARLFGDFDLHGAAPALHAPGPTVVVSTPASRRGRESLSAVPSDRWLQAMPSLWIRSAGPTLLLASTDDGLTGRLLRPLGG